MTTDIWNDTEQSLLIQIQQGNQQAFGKLYDKYAPMLMGLVMRLVSDNKIAEEVLQEVFARIWDNRSVFDCSKERLFSKLLKITRETAGRMAGSTKTISAEQIQEHDKRVYFSSIDILPAEQNNAISVTSPFNREIASREALDLIYFNGCSFADAAAILDVPVHSLKENVKMAIEKLKTVAMI